jgi:uncharacterized protein YlxW (UPF0749 family)
MDNPYYASRPEILDVPPPASRTPRWFWPLTVMTFILGALIAAALKTEGVVLREFPPAPSVSGPAMDYVTYQNTFNLQQKTIEELQKRNEILERGVVTKSPEPNELAGQLDQYRFLAGITPVTGPGVSVTLRDSTKAVPIGLPSEVANEMNLSFTIHDLDIQRVVNELRAAGAEAFAVNDQRIVATTAIRCVGPAIQVNGVPLTPPYVIRAIGDPATLAGALELRGGINEQLKQTDTAMIQIQNSNSLMLPSYNGSVTFAYCKPVKDMSSVGNNASAVSTAAAVPAGSATQ